MFRLAAPTSSRTGASPRLASLASVLSVICVAIVAGPAVSGQTTFPVTKTADTNDGDCSGSDCSLREAVIAANAEGSTDIDVPAGTYKLTRGGRDEDLAATGDLGILKSVTIRGEGARRTVIDASGIDRAIHTPIQGLSATPFIVRIFGVKVTGGDIPEGGGSIAHHARGATLNLTSSTVSGSSARQGGGIQSGGGQGFGETVEITGSTVSNNRAPDGQGGGIQNMENLTLENTTVSGNTSTFGGGIMQFNGTLRITYSTIAFNTSQQPGGGITVNLGTPVLKIAIVSNNNPGIQGFKNCNIPVDSEGNNPERGAPAAASPGPPTRTPTRGSENSPTTVVRPIPTRSRDAAPR